MIVEKIFGKDINSIEESDLNKIIGIPETSNVEFKSIPDINPTLKPWQRKKEEEHHKENIVKSVVGFLNANDNGLLVLGVTTEDEKADKIVGVDKDVLKQLKTEISLEAFLKEKVKAIPSYLSKFKLETKIVGYKSRIVVFIEVVNKNGDRIYYSDITQYVYIRKGKSTNPLSIPDTLKLIAERSYPQVYAEFKEKGAPCKDMDKIYPTYRFNFINKGVKPAKKVHCFVLIGSDDEIDLKSGGCYTSPYKDLNSEIYGLNSFILDNTHIKAFQFIFPGSGMDTDKIYPFKKYSSGYLAIMNNDMNKIKEVIVLTVEDNGFVKQKFKVSTKGTKKYFEETKSEFNPYITI